MVHSDGPLGGDALIEPLLKESFFMNTNLFPDLKF